MGFGITVISVHTEIKTKGTQNRTNILMYQAVRSTAAYIAVKSLSSTLNTDITLEVVVNYLYPSQTD